MVSEAREKTFTCTTILYYCHNTRRNVILGLQGASFPPRSQSRVIYGRDITGNLWARHVFHARVGAVCPHVYRLIFFVVCLHTRAILHSGKNRSVAACVWVYCAPRDLRKKLPAIQDIVRARRRAVRRLCGHCADFWWKIATG